MGKLSVLVEHFAEDLRERLGGSGNKEEALKIPVNDLLTSAYQEMLDISVLVDQEVSLRSLIGAQPDQEVRERGSERTLAYVELKRPGRYLPLHHGNLDDTDLIQFQKLSELPSVIYTDGITWIHYSYGQVQLSLTLPLDTTGRLTGPVSEAELESFLSAVNGQQRETRTLSTFVPRFARLTALLRDEVQTAVDADPADGSLSELRSDWKKLHNEDLSNGFPDSYAQTVAFALFVARINQVDLGEGAGVIGSRLRLKNSLMGDALKWLVNDAIVEGPYSNILAAFELVRGLVQSLTDEAVDTDQDLSIHLYEDFLEEYDPALKRKTGSYFTPVEVVESMVSLVDSAIKTHTSVESGLGGSDVVVIDPAMGTGTYPVAIIEHVAREARRAHGDAHAKAAVEDLRKRLIGIEIQAGSYSVAQVRIAQALRSHKAATTKTKLYLDDTLADPGSDDDQPSLFNYMPALSAARKEVAKAKRSRGIQVVIGNPPYKDKDGVGDESGGGIKDAGGMITAIPRNYIGDFAAVKGTPAGDRASGNRGQTQNLAHYFWRWGLLKAVEENDGRFGIVAFITTAAYIHSDTLAGMRDYMARSFDHIYVVDVDTRYGGSVFNIGTATAIVVGFRDLDHPHGGNAQVHYMDLGLGDGDSKLRLLQNIKSVEDSRFVLLDREDPSDNFRDEGGELWKRHPALQDIFLCGIGSFAASRTWPIAVDQQTLELRREEFNRRRDARVVPYQLGLKTGSDLATGEALPKLRLDGTDTLASTARIGYKSFIRGYIIADGRILRTTAPDIWECMSDSQVYLTQMPSVTRTGYTPCVSISAYPPDKNSTRGSQGGRTHPMLLADGSYNMSDRLLSYISDVLGVEVTGEEMMAYIAGISAYPAYCDRYANYLELKAGARIPLTRDPVLWARVVELGRTAIWSGTLGERFGDGLEVDGVPRRKAPERLIPPSGNRPRLRTPITELPRTVARDLSYDNESEILRVSDGVIENVRPEVFHFNVQGMPVIKKWTELRLVRPRIKSREDPNEEIEIFAAEWQKKWTEDLLQILDALTVISSSAVEQAEVLRQVDESPLITMSELREAGVVVTASERNKWPERINGALFATEQ